MWSSAWPCFVWRCCRPWKYLWPHRRAAPRSTRQRTAPARDVLDNTSRAIAAIRKTTYSSADCSILRAAAITITSLKMTLAAFRGEPVGNPPRALWAGWSTRHQWPKTSPAGLQLSRRFLAREAQWPRLRPPRLARCDVLKLRKTTGEPPGAISDQGAHRFRV